MFWVGASLAIAAGLGYNVAAALEKREALAAPFGLRAMRLLGVLARRRLWIVAAALSLLAWVAETAALALAPIAMVMPLLAAGRAILVLLGILWLGERFGRKELAGIGLVSVGAVAAAVAAGGSSVSRTPVSFWTQVLLGIVVLAGALAVTQLRTGVAFGVAAGILYTATAIYSKEIGDAFAVHGLGAWSILAQSPAPWALIVLAIGAQALVQAGFQRANAASVTSAMAAVATPGPVIIGLFLYGERFSAGARGAILGIGLAGVVLGLALLPRSAGSPVGGVARPRSGRGRLQIRRGRNRVRGVPPDEHHDGEAAGSTPCSGMSVTRAPSAEVKQGSPSLVLNRRSSPAPEDRRCRP